MQMKIIRTDDSIQHVALVGRLDVRGVNAVQYEFLQQTSLIPRSTLVDLSKVSYIASLGIGMLVSAAKALERRGGKMVLIGPSDLVRETLETSSLHSLIPIADEEAGALALLG